MKVRYYKLFELLKKRRMRFESMQRKIGLHPHAIARIESNRMLDPSSLFLICHYFGCTIDDIMEYWIEEERDTFASARLLERYSYTPPTIIPKEFKMP